jgi:spore coat polysaccharide biosynthesis protein SpsF
MMHPVIFVQARMASTRLPGKVLLPLVGHPMLWHIVQRCRAADGVAAVVVATTDQLQDAPIRDFCTREGIPYFAGSEPDVLDRYYRAACTFGADPVLRVTGDCPCIEPMLLAEVLRVHQEERLAVLGAATGAGAVGVPGYHWPDGLDVECYSMEVLQYLWCVTTEQRDREHVSPYAFRHLLGGSKIGRVFAPAELGHHRWTVDHPEDFALVTHVYEALWTPGRHFGIDDVVQYLDAHPEVYALNRMHIDNEGYQALWQEP